MINETNVRLVANRELGTDRASLIREVPLPRPDCSLTIWGDRRTMPPHAVTLFEHPDGVFNPGASLDTFGAMLRVVRPTLADIRVVDDLVRTAAPPRLSLVLSCSSVGWMDRYASVWHEPMLKDGGLEVYCADILAGRYCRLTISSDYYCELSYIGPGKRLGRR